MSFKFNCPKCGQHIEAEEGMIGKVADCPGCSETIEIPAPVEVSTKPAQGKLQARKKSSNQYFICIPSDPQRVVGPNTVFTLRVWVGMGAISADWQACREGSEDWMPISQIPGFSEPRPDVDSMVESFQPRQNDQSRDEPATEKQLARLQFYEIPFAREGLTKWRASQLIDLFLRIDPARDEQYENRPATAQQREEAESLGGDASGLTYSQARDLLEDLRLEPGEEIAESANSKQLRDAYHYRELDKDHLCRLVEYYNKREEDWAYTSEYEMAETIVRLFPELVER